MLIIWDWFKTLFNPLSGGLYPDAKDIVHYFSVISVNVLITTGAKGTDKKLRLRTIRASSIGCCFDEIILNYKTPALFESVINRYKESKSDVYIIGDRVSYEIKIANLIKVKSILVDRDNKEDISESCYWRRVKNLLEVKDIISLPSLS